MQRNERGAVTVEAAASLPILVVFTAALAWFVMFGTTQVLVIDAARETARALVRGETEAAAWSLGRQVAPAGSQVQVVDDGRTITVTVTAQPGGPKGILAGLPLPAASGSATAAREPGT